jgi:hypothetical protein
MNTDSAEIVDNLIKLTESLCAIVSNRSGNYESINSLAAQELFRKQLDVLKETRSFSIKDPNLARALLYREDEISWAIQRLEDLVSING